MIKIKEQESDYQCSQKHQKPIVAIDLNENLTTQNRLLCADCIQNKENNIKTLGWKKAVVKIEQELEYKYQVTEKLISPFLGLLKEFQSNLEQLRIFILNQIDSLQLIVNQWKQNLQNEQMKMMDYKFLEELEYVVQNEILYNINNQCFEDKIRNKIREVHSKWITQADSKFMQIKEFEQLKSCQEKIKLIEKLGKRQIIQLNKELKLPLIKLDSNDKGVQYYQYDPYQMNIDHNYKQIIFIGQKDQGKSTLIDAFVNYYFSIKFDDTFRLRVSKNESTSEITSYYIPPYGSRTQGINLIDTPGFHYQNDYEIMNQIINTILDYQDPLTLVFCLKAQTNRDTQESVQTLQQFFQVLGQNQSIKLVIAHTIYTGENNNIVNHEDDKILNQLDLSYYVEINADSIVRKSLGNDSKKLFEQNIEKLKVIEFEQQVCNLTLSVRMQIVSQRVKSKMDYSNILNQSYNQVKQLFMQNVQVYFKNKQQQFFNKMIRLFYLKKIEIQSNTFQFNCDFHILTCLAGFKNQIDAQDFWVMLNNQCICGCTPERISIRNQQIVYEEENTLTYNEEVYQENLLITKLTLRRIFYFLFNLYILKSQNQECKQSEFFEMIKNEEKQNNNNDLEFCQQICLGQIQNQQNVQQNYQQQMTQNNNQQYQQNLTLNTQKLQNIEQHLMLNNQQHTPQRVQQNNKQIFFGQQTQNVPLQFDQQGQFHYYPNQNVHNHQTGQYLQSPYKTTNDQVPVQNTMRF